VSSNHADIRGAVESIVRLRRASRRSDGEVHRDIEATLSYLERIAGPTLSRAETARLLGISHTALDRWVEKGDIPAVVTPSGRREIPLAQVVDLLETIGGRADEGPLALSRVIRDRRRQAAAISESDFLPTRRPRPRTHRVPDLHALAYHRVVAQRLDDVVVRDAQKRLQRWKRDGRIDSRWAEEWEQILALPLPRIAKAISSNSERGRALRQSSPFAGSLNEHERRRIAQAVEERVAR
jgi:hypothetical protein